MNEFTPSSSNSSQNITPPNSNQSPIPNPYKKKIRTLLYIFIIVALILIFYIFWGTQKIYFSAKPKPAPTPAVPHKATIIERTVAFFRIITTSKSNKGMYVCTPTGGCVVFPPQDAEKYCPKTYQTEKCNDECSNPQNRCSQ